MIDSVVNVFEIVLKCWVVFIYVDIVFKKVSVIERKFEGVIKLLLVYDFVFFCYLFNLCVIE